MTRLRAIVGAGSKRSRDQHRHACRAWRACSFHVATGAGRFVRDLMSPKTGCLSRTVHGARGPVDHPPPQLPQPRGTARQPRKTVSAFVMGGEGVLDLVSAGGNRALRLDANAAATTVANCRRSSAGRPPILNVLVCCAGHIDAIAPRS